MRPINVSFERFPLDLLSALILGGQKKRPKKQKTKKDGRKTIGEHLVFPWKKQEKKIEEEEEEDKCNRL